MILVAILAGPLAKGRLGSPPAWTVAGCIATAVALLGLVFAARVGPAWPLQANVFVLGLANGVYAAAAIGSMMAFAVPSRDREGTRMGLWGAGQAMAMGCRRADRRSCGRCRTPHARHAILAYASVFAGEAILFLIAALIAAKVAVMGQQARPTGGRVSDLNAIGGYALNAHREPSR